MSIHTAAKPSSQSNLYPNHVIAIGVCITQHVSGGLARYVVKTIQGIQVFSDFDMKVRALDVITTLFDIEKGNTFQQEAA
ncbi:hypothetical protein [Gilvimarinus polysaccharolyticus]|uniref:hypothetical protein n=1 Tax=Gilvimarinus polysaccharolyticus TaxID=863921 RepID=UPI00067369FA|nr:hypothetical protein [Gilvimarinus polysaccharolyticus]